MRSYEEIDKDLRHIRYALKEIEVNGWPKDVYLENRYDDLCLEFGQFAYTERKYKKLEGLYSDKI